MFRYTALRYLLYLLILAFLVLFGMMLWGPLGIVIAVFVAAALLLMRLITR